MTKVTVEKVDFYDTKVVAQAMQDLLAYLGGIEKYIQPGNTVLAKSNMLEGVDKIGVFTKFFIGENRNG
jgi:uncharacterized protein (DUF362 family)